MPQQQRNDNAGELMVGSNRRPSENSGEQQAPSAPIASRTKSHGSKDLTKDTIRSASALASASNGDLWLSDKTPERGGGRLLIRITPAGTKTCYFKYFHNRKAHLIPMGPYSASECEGFITLDQARTLARKFSALHRNPQTADVRAHVAGLKSRECSGNPSEDVSLFALCEEYVANLRQRGKDESARNAESQMIKHLKSHPIASRPAVSVSRGELIDYLRDLTEMKIPHTTIHIKGLLHAAYNMGRNVDSNVSISKAFRRFGIENNPLSGMKLGIVLEQRTRNLDAIELGHFWLELNEGIDSRKPANRLVKLGLLLGGQRSAQLRRCLKSNVDLSQGTITLFDPKGRRSTPRAHVLPLTASASEEVRWWLAVSDSLNSKYLFPGVKENSCYSDTTCSVAVAKICKRLLKDGRSKAHFHHQDLRRTAETRMAQIGVSKDIRAQILSHGISGIQSQVYDMHEYLPEKLKALQLWEASILHWTAIARAEVLQQSAAGDDNFATRRSPG